MAQRTSIGWTQYTWNPVRGCSRVSGGCKNCFAEDMAARFSTPGNWGEGLARFVTRPDGKREPRWTGAVHMAPEDTLLAPLKWKGPALVFVNSTSDLFHEGFSDEDIDKVFAVMALCPQLTLQVLTKRPERMREYIRRKNPNGHHPAMDYVALMAATGRWNTPALNLRTWPLPNVWLGVSIEDQDTANTRIPYLLDTPAAVRFVSAEPLLGAVDLRNLPLIGTKRTLNALTGIVVNGLKLYEGQIDQVIVGGESGRNARPMHPDWARTLRDQCALAGVPLFFKQWGAHAVVYDRDRDDPDWRECDRIARETPNGRWLNLEGGHGFHGERVVRVVPVGKAKAGRLLDGQLHDGMPQAGRAGA